MQIHLLSSVAASELEEIGRLRTAVWSRESDVNPKSLGPEPWIDQEDHGASIWTVRDQGRLAATARLTVHERPELIPYHSAFQDRLAAIWPAAAARLQPRGSSEGNGAAEPGPVDPGSCESKPGLYASMNRLVVHPDYRGRGIARMLDCLRLRHAPQVGAALVVVVASGRRVAALESLGFENLGPPGKTPALLRTEQKYSILAHQLRQLPAVPAGG
jgi:GNAT superfamily N-acetyltransferase